MIDLEKNVAHWYCKTYRAMCSSRFQLLLSNKSDVESKNSDGKPN